MCQKQHGNKAIVLAVTLKSRLNYHSDAFDMN